MEAIIVRTPVVSDPFAVVVHVRGFRMVVAVPIRVLVPIVIVIIVAVSLVRVAVISRGPVMRYISSTHVVVLVVVVVVIFLGEGGQGEDQSRCKDSGKQFH
jgi:hypothetical protein